MSILQVSQTVIAPAAKAFTAFADLEGWKTWSPYVLAVEKITDGPLGVGSKFQIDNKGAGKMEMEIIQFEPPQRLKFRGVGSMVEMTHAYLFLRLMS